VVDQQGNVQQVRPVPYYLRDGALRGAVIAVLFACEVQCNVKPDKKLCGIKPSARQAAFARMWKPINDVRRQYDPSQASVTSDDELLAFNIPMALGEQQPGRAAMATSSSSSSSSSAAAAAPPLPEGLKELEPDERSQYSMLHSDEMDMARQQLEEIKKMETLSASAAATREFILCIWEHIEMLLVGSPSKPSASPPGGDASLPPAPAGSRKRKPVGDHPDDPADSKKKKARV